jgi:diadenosine tetraphosphate (Ap4A) HIT family hydrolase
MSVAATSGELEDRVGAFLSSAEVKSAAWADAERWRSLSDGSGCPICTRGEPSDLIAEFASTWVTAAREAPLPGYACVVSKMHVVEPFELSVQEQNQFWTEAMGVAQALTEFSGCVKMNYGIHGNVIPHLHLHLWPRLVDDPYDTGGIPAGVASFTRNDRYLARMAAALHQAR